jgi:hypothetical protein
MNDTTRRHPRTLDEAFPSTASYACPVEAYKRPGGVLWPVIRACLCLAIFAGIGVLLAWRG